MNTAGHTFMQNVGSLSLADYIVPVSTSVIINSVEKWLVLKLSRRTIVIVSTFTNK